MQQCIFILTTLLALLNIVDVLNVVLYFIILSNNVYQSFNDSCLFHQHPLVFENSNYLKIALYCDEFETANPLGRNKIYEIMEEEFLLDTFKYS